jgi:hypothetical protein
MEETLKLRCLVLALLTAGLDTSVETAGTSARATFLRQSVESPERHSAFPQVEISNGLVKATVLLPDPEHGYYRGSRFDWDGVVESLTYKGHSFFGKWFEEYSPTSHDAIMGPVEEFRGDAGELGYDEAKAGGYFVKIGVGILRKVDDAQYAFYKSYPVVSVGKRIVTPAADRVSFQQELSNGEGYAYVYKKTLRLARGKPELIIEHSLRNAGRRVIDTNVYNHDFYMIDNQPAGPAYRVKFAFKPQAKDDLKDLAEIRGDELVYLRELKTKEESVATPITGFGETVKDNDVIVENTKAQAGVREIGDHPLSSMYFWSIRTTVCPEAYIHIRIEPGKTFTWKIVYRFYTLE